MNVLLLIVGIPAIAAAVLLALPARAHGAVRGVAFTATFVVLLLASWLALGWSDRVSAPGATSKAPGIEDVRRRELLPLFRRRGAQRAFEGYGAQHERLETEPGVRQQL